MLWAFVVCYRVNFNFCILNCWYYHIFHIPHSLYLYTYKLFSTTVLVFTFMQGITITYLKQTVFLGYIILQLFCIYSLCYMSCYFAREMCFVPLHQHFPQYVCSAQYDRFWTSFISFFLGTLLRYCASDFEMVPAAPIITGITFAFTFHTRWIIMRSLYFNIFSAYIIIIIIIIILQ